ncbi:MAG: winged helix-turn-helix transcriptional regulator [Nitrospinae bacterium]|nr:winged helix-turn-helix transcriptional regulator [Nitrospinota bacterium]
MALLWGMSQKDTSAVVRRLLRLGAFLQRTGDRLLGDFRLTQQSFIVLQQIRENGPLRQKDICSGLLFEKSNISKITAKLFGLGLIRVARSPHDARASRISITAKGAMVAGRAMKRLDQWNAAWLKPLDSSSARAIREALGQLENLVPREP